MDDSPTHSPAPQEGGNQNPPDKKPGDKSTRKPKKKLATANGKKGTDTKALLTISNSITVVVEVAGLVLWQIADIFHGFKCNLIHSISVGCFVAGVAIFVNKALDKARDIWILWISYAVICLIFAGIIFGNSGPQQSSTVSIGVLPPNISGFIVTETNLIKETNVFIETNVVVQTNQPVATEWMPPLLPTGCEVVSITYGESDSSNPIRVGSINLMEGQGYGINRQKIMEILIGGNINSNRLYINAVIPGTFPFGPFKISGNKIIGHLPPSWQMNFDGGAVEIVNGYEIPVFQVIYERPEAVKVYGVFGNEFQVFVLTSQSHLDGLSPNDWYSGDKFNPASMGLRRIFKYPFWEYQGQRVKYDN